MGSVGGGVCVGRDITEGHLQKVKSRPFVKSGPIFPARGISKVFYSVG